MPTSVGVTATPVLPNTPRTQPASSHISSSIVIRAASSEKRGNTTQTPPFSARANAEQVKTLVEQLKRHNHRAAVEHCRIYRPWGYYQDIDIAPRYRVKRIVVKPGSKLSLQKHFHRSEHWIVVTGTAEVTLGDDVRIVHENESVYIPIGSIHRLANPGKIPLELVEVQAGSYLGEDDIVRINDVYGRG